MTVCWGWFEIAKIWRWHGTTLTRSDEQDSTCTEVERMQRKEARLNMVKWLHMSTWVTQNTRWTSPFESLHFSTPKPYKTWHHLNFQSSVANSNEFRGLSARCTTCIFGKGQMAKPMSPCWSLGKTTQNSYMGCHIWILGSSCKNQKKRGPFLHIYHHSKIGKGKMQNKHHHDDQWLKLPQIHIWDAPNEIQV